MIAVFVSKNEEEFRKYACGLSVKDKERARLKYGGELWDSYSYKLPSRDKTVFGATKSVTKAPKSLEKRMSSNINAANVSSDLSNTILYSAHTKNEKDDYNYVVICGSKIKDKARDGNFDKESVDEFLEAIKMTVMRAFSDKIELKDIKLFVHWGSGADLINTYEIPFQTRCDELAKSHGFDMLFAYALSSRRSHLFDVSRIKISLPKTYDELIKLENKFRNALVDEVFSYCAAKLEKSISQEREEIVNRLNRFASSVLNSSLDAEKKNELLRAVAKAKIEELNNAKDTSNETAAFVAQILNREVLNG